MKKEVMKWLKQLLAENDEVERNSIKRRIIVNFPKLEFIVNDKIGEQRFKDHLRLSLALFCKETNDFNRQGLVDTMLKLERLFV